MMTRKVFRRPVQVVVAAVAFALVELAFLGLILSMTLARFWLGVGIMSAGFVLTAVPAIRIPRMAVVADGRGLTVRNMFRTRWIPWSDVYAFVVEFGAVNVVLQNKRWVSCGGLSRARYESSQKLEPIAAELTARLRAAKNLAPAG